MKFASLAASVVMLACASAAGAVPNQNAVQNAVPGPLLAAVSATQSAKAAYAFDLSYASDRGNLRAHYDPKAAPHVTMIEPPRDRLSGDQRRVFQAYQQQIEGLSWCAGERLGRIANVGLLREDADSVTYGFQPTRESTRGQGGQFADRLRGELTLSRANPDVLALHIFSPAAFDVMPLVHIANIDIAITCAPAPNGRRYAAQTISQTTGNAFGQAINEHSVQRVTNLSVAP
jgi:hypothetical protein